jgi:hypothetical protein
VSSDRLAIFMPTLEGGGAQRSMVKLAGGLTERGHAVDMVLGRAEGPYLPPTSSRSPLGRSPSPARAW